MFWDHLLLDCFQSLNFGIIHVIKYYPKTFTFIILWHRAGHSQKTPQSKASVACCWPSAGFQNLANQKTVGFSRRRHKKDFKKMNLKQLVWHLLKKIFSKLENKTILLIVSLQMINAGYQNLPQSFSFLSVRQLDSYNTVSCLNVCCRDFSIYTSCAAGQMKKLIDLWKYVHNQNPACRYRNYNGCSETLTGTEAQRFNSHLEIGDTVWCAVG